MGVYLRGVDMPHEGYCNIRLYPNGKVSVTYFDAQFVAEAVEVEEPHGDLIDRDTLMYKARKWDNDYAPDGYDHIVEVDDIKNAPTIIAAEG